MPLPPNPHFLSNYRGAGVHLPNQLIIAARSQRKDLRARAVSKPKVLVGSIRGDLNSTKRALRSRRVALLPFPIDV